MAPGPSTLLICTVGGTPDPVVAAIRHWRPVRVRFVHTPRTRPDIAATIVPKANEASAELDAGRYDLLELPDEEDLGSCIDRLRQLAPDVEGWLARGEGFRVVVDFTGGTKCMSAAMALQARRWPCLFSYVGGSERTREGVGIVVSGTERVVHQANPWDELGHQAVEDFIVLFDRRAFVAAAGAAEKSKKHVTSEARKRELSALEQLAKAFESWDRFEHKNAATAFKNVEKAANDLRAVLGAAKADRLLDEIASFTSHLGRLGSAPAPGWHHVVDLLSNARRRKEEGRLDDAVARLYRAIEAVAQVGLKERHGFGNTERVPLDRTPPPLRSAWESKATEGLVTIGLQEAFALLAGLNDPVGDTFRSLGLHDDTKSPLIVRNRSILAHGFEPVPAQVFDRLWRAALTLTGITESDLPAFSTLG